MNRVIVFQQGDGAVALMTPCDRVLTVEQIGEKDVPDGVPFWVIDASSLPDDQTFFNAWELDVASMGGPAGIGRARQENAA